MRVLSFIASTIIAGRLSSFLFPFFAQKIVNGGQEGMIGLDPVTLIQGNLPPRVLGLVIEWATMYSKEDVLKSIK